MLFHVRMDVRLPADMPVKEANAMKAKEKAISHRLQRSGKWPHLWRIAGHYANISIFDVTGADELHDILCSLPLFPYMKMQVTALAKHPSKI